MGRSIRHIFLVLTFVVLATATGAQTTAFTYQGTLTTAGSPANGNFDFQFLLFGAASGGTQIGLGSASNNVAVADGLFTAFVNFGNQFPGAERWIEIRVRPSGQGSFTTLTPRQPITSSPHSIKSLNSELLAGVPASQYVLTTDARLTDARTPLPNSTNYVQNRTSQQSGTSFNVSGSGSVGGLFTVGDNATFQKAVAVTTDLDVGQKISAGGNVLVGGTLAVGSQANVVGAVNTSTQFNVGGNFVLNRNRLSLFNSLAVPRGFSFEVMNNPSYLQLKSDTGAILMTIGLDGKVGIGESNPTIAALEVVGGLRVGGLGNGHLCSDGSGIIQTCSALNQQTESEKLAAAKIEVLEAVIRKQSVEITRQHAELTALKQLVCSTNRAAAVCKEEE